MAAATAADAFFSSPQITDLLVCRAAGGDGVCKARGGASDGAKDEAGQTAEEENGLFPPQPPTVSPMLIREARLPGR